MSPDAPTPDEQATIAGPLLAGRYQVLEQLGQGGMGAVFRARDAQLERAVALKMLPDGCAPDAGAVARFRREAKALARLSHPGIIQAYDSGEDRGRPFLVMELVEGRSLAAVLREQGRVAPARAADFAYQAAQALHHAHRSGLVHRDVKPSNLLLSADGRVRLLDLGLARFLRDQVGDTSLTREGTGLGTPDYASPEQSRDGRRADARSDVYALGCTLYHLIAGRVPFPGSSFSEKVEAHEAQEPAPLEELCPDVPAGLALAVRRMMAKRPADRFQTMAEVAEALMPHVAGSSAVFPQIRNSATWDGSRLATVTAVPRRRRFRAVTGATAAVLLLAGIVGLVGFAAGWFRLDGSRVVENRSTAPAPADTSAGRDAPAPPADDPNVLTVSKEEKDGGKYRTINDALKDVRPWATVRVLDGREYEEAVLIGSPSQHEGLTLEAPAGATIVVPRLAQVGIHVRGVPHVAVRGFRIRAEKTEQASVYLTAISGACQGVVLDGLDLRSVNVSPSVGVGLEDVAAPAGAAPNVIQNCTLSGLLGGVRLLGLSGTDRRNPLPCRDIVVRRNRIFDCGTGVWAAGQLKDVQIVGNTVWNCGDEAVHIFATSPGTEGFLVANNTLRGHGRCLHVKEPLAGAAGVEIRNNLLLSDAGPDMAWTGEDRQALATWTIAGNWHQGRPPAPGDAEAQASIVSPADHWAERIEVKSPDPNDPDYLRPPSGSPLAGPGSGQGLPDYVGAVPPVGSSAWDWDRTWRARVKRHEGQK